MYFGHWNTRHQIKRRARPDCSAFAEPRSGERSVNRSYLHTNHSTHVSMTYSTVRTASFLLALPSPPHAFPSCQPRADQPISPLVFGSRLRSAPVWASYAPLRASSSRLAWCARVGCGCRRSSGDRRIVCVRTSRKQVWASIVAFGVTDFLLRRKTMAQNRCIDSSNTCICGLRMCTFCKPPSEYGVLKILWPRIPPSVGTERAACMYVRMGR